MTPYSTSTMTHLTHPSSRGAKQRGDLSLCVYPTAKARLPHPLTISPSSWTQTPGVRNDKISVTSCPLGIARELATWRFRSLSSRAKRGDLAFYVHSDNSSLVGWLSPGVLPQMIRDAILYEHDDPPYASVIARELATVAISPCMYTQQQK